MSDVPVKKPRKPKVDDMGLNKTQRKAWEKINRAGVLLTAPNGSYNLPNGRTVSPTLVSALIARGCLRNNEDSLFAGMRPQTLSPVHPLASPL